MSETAAKAEPVPAPAPSYQGERVSVAVAGKDGRVVMRFGSGSLSMPATAAHELARQLEEAALIVEPPSSGAAIAAIAIEGALREGG